MAHFEIHVLNFNGLRYLKPCLDALEAIDKGGHEVHVNIVDNGSTDSSKEFVQKNYPNVSFVALDKNYGFTEGNNKGARIAAERSIASKGKPHDYDVFLNNDTEVTKNWLINAANVLENQADVGIVGSKALFMDRFVMLRVKISPPYKPSLHGSPDSRVLGGFLKTPIKGINIKEDQARYRWKGAYGTQQGGRWLASESVLMIPIQDQNQEAKFDLSLSFTAEQADNIQIEFFLNNDDKAFLVKQSKAGSIEEYNFEFSSKDYVSVIQNMGNFITKDLDAGDLGFGEIDDPEDLEPKEVAAVCGVSMFVRQSIFSKLGGFDKKYFAYFEDADLSVRTRLLGYKCKVVPSSVLYHLHCGSSGGEWSKTFSRLVAFSHLLFNSKFATKSVWDRRLMELKQAAKDQFEIYAEHNDLDSTPQLRAYLSYLKKPHVFLLNRFRYRAIAKELESFPFVAQKPAS